LKQSSKNSKPRRKRESIRPPASGRKWPFRLVAIVFIPLVFLGGLEAALRLAGCGYPTGFLEKIRVGEKEFLVNNENFSLRFFPPQLARWPGPVMMEATKPANTYRILIFGESAARGEPEPPYAASRYLEALLNERFPNTHFQTVNLGITAINSHVILPIARDCVKADGDLWIIYMGNNEMVGPFGAATVFGTKAPPLGFVRLNLAIQQTRVGQLLVKLGRKLKGKSSNESWGGMNMFAGNQLRADDPRKQVVYQNFQRNLDDIVKVGLDSGAKILLNTVAVNLKDCPPFASLANSNLPAAERAKFDKLYAEACSAEAQNNDAEAARKFEPAAALDPQFPELQYRWGECLAAMSNFAGAREHFQKACDYDALPFRADSRINGIIQKTAQQFAGDKLAFFDAAAAMAANTSNGVCGRETFYEHVHFNFDGNFRLGRAWAEQVAKMLPAGISQAARTNFWAAQETCDQLLALTDWNRCAVVETMVDRLKRPPLSGQANNTERMRLLRDEARELRQHVNPAAAQKAVEIYLAAINRTPRDHLLHENFAEFLESSGDLKQAVAQWQRMQELLPHSCEPFYQTGRLLSELGQWAEAEAVLTKAVTLRPRLAEGWFELGGVHLSTQEFESALHNYNRARQLDPANATYCAYAGKALSKLNRQAEAVQLYRQAIQLQPDLWEVHFALGDELGAASQFAEAENEYEQVIRLRPALAMAHLDRGVMLARLGQFDKALEEFEETLHLEPGNRQAQEYFERVKGWKNNSIKK
jgi:tetratricopeptide (TPR) repeat protein